MCIKIYSLKNIFTIIIYMNYTKKYEKYKKNMKITYKLGEVN